MEKIEKKEIILVVDDSPANLQLCNGLLSVEYNVRLAKSGEMALKVIAKLKPDIILLDIEMPGMSGFDVMKEISKDMELRKIPVVFVTSYATGEYLSDAVNYGAANYVVKPFESDALRAKIRNALKKRKTGINDEISFPLYVNP